MNLLFDRGTILVKDPSEVDPNFGQRHPKLSAFPGILWDERVRMFRAPGYRYPDLLKFLKSSGNITDSVFHREKLDGKWTFPDLRPYQREALCAWDFANRRGIAVLPTGGGKTRLALAAMAKMGASSLCLVPTRILLEQWLKEIKKFYSGKVGIYGDGHKELAPITISTFESAYRNMSQIGNRFDLLIIDEAHHFGNGMRDEALEMSTAQARLGLTATMTRDEAVLTKITSLVGSPICELTIGDLSGTYLSNFDLYSLQLDLNHSERITYEKDMALFKEVHSKFRASFPDADWPMFARFAAKSETGREAMRAFLRARKLTAFTQAKAEALESILKRHWRRRILIFTADTTTAHTIAKNYLIMPLTSKTARKEREEILKQFRSGELNVLVSCRVLNEGIDVPDADIAMIIGGSHGEREHVQRIGRLLRPVEGKRALVYELICRGTLEIRQWKKRNLGLGTRIPA